jgi:hypothetical protein
MERDNKDFDTYVADAEKELEVVSVGEEKPIELPVVESPTGRRMMLREFLSAKKGMMKAFEVWCRKKDYKVAGTKLEWERRYQEFLSEPSV